MKQSSPTENSQHNQNVDPSGRAPCDYNAIGAVDVSGCSRKISDGVLFGSEQTAQAFEYIKFDSIICGQ